MSRRTRRKAKPAHKYKKRATTLADVFKKPFTLDIASGYIFDSDNRMVVQIRGWGYIHTTFGVDPGEIIQDTMAEKLVDAMNAMDLDQEIDYGSLFDKEEK